MKAKPKLDFNAIKVFNGHLDVVRHVPKTSQGVSIHRDLIAAGILGNRHLLICVVARRWLEHANQGVRVGLVPWARVTAGRWGSVDSVRVEIVSHAESAADGRDLMFCSANSRDWKLQCKRPKLGKPCGRMLKEAGAYGIGLIAKEETTRGAKLGEVSRNLTVLR